MLDVGDFSIIQGTGFSALASPGTGGSTAQNMQRIPRMYHFYNIAGVTGAVQGKFRIQTAPPSPFVFATLVEAEFILLANYSYMVGIHRDLLPPGRWWVRTQLELLGGTSISFAIVEIGEAEDKPSSFHVNTLNTGLFQLDANGNKRIQINLMP